MADDDKLQQLVDQIFDLPAEKQAELIQQLIEMQIGVDPVDEEYGVRA